MPDILLACANAERIPLADNSVHVVVTSPPYYGLRAYKAGEGEIGLEESPELYLEHMVAVFREVRRVLRDDGVCWVNMGDSYANNPGNGRGGETPDGGIPHRSGTDKTHAGYKPLDLMNIPARLVLALQAAGWYHRSTIIWAKCLSHSTRVYAKTQKGMQPVPVGDLARLDPTTIELWTGKQWALVKSISKSLQTEGIELAFRNGQRISCTTNHRWVLRGGQITWANDLKVGDRLESATLPESHKAVDYIPDSIGWFIGMFIAEGSFGKKGKVIQISSHKDETLRFELLQEIANDYDGTCQMHRTSENGATINIYSPALIGIINQYVNGHSAKNKHLSMKCWQRSNDFLLAILTGYLEGDGHFDGQRWRLGFTRNDMWADDLRTLGARLGKSVRLKRAWHKMGDKKFYGFRGSIAEHHKRRTDDWEIIGIQKSKSRAFFDIEIEAPHVFALADGLLTHNSNPMPESVNGWRWERCRVKVEAGGTSGDALTTNRLGKGVRLGDQPPGLFATWADCPGCEKCAPNGGLVLRRGSWRPTTSHEYIFMMTKTDRYFADGEAVREESITGNGMPQGIAGGKRFGGTPKSCGVCSRFGERVL